MSLSFSFSFDFHTPIFNFSHSFALCFIPPSPSLQIFFHAMYFGGVGSVLLLLLLLLLLWWWWASL